MKKRKIPLFFVKWLNYEYWPFWLFFLPLIPYWIYLAIRAKSFTYFTAANPGIEHGGVFGESKIDILNKINKRYLPKTIFFKSSTAISKVILMINEYQIDFPLIIKPNIGERGNDVERIDDQQALQIYLNSASGDLIIQEFVDYEIELGVLYYRFPDSDKTGITSVVTKEFLTVIGDGESTIIELLEENDRARFQLESLKKKLGDQMSIVLAKGQQRNIQPIGNHCKGTKFLSGMNLLNPKLVQVFDDVASESQFKICMLAKTLKSLN
jgi:regulator of replication initiation timing